MEIPVCVNHSTSHLESHVSPRSVWCCDLDCLVSGSKESFNGAVGFRRIPGARSPMNLSQFRFVMQTNSANTCPEKAPPGMSCTCQTLEHGTFQACFRERCSLTSRVRSSLLWCKGTKNSSLCKVVSSSIVVVLSRAFRIHI